MGKRRTFKHAGKMVEAIKEEFGEYANGQYDWEEYFTKEKIRSLLRSAPVLSDGEIEVLSRVPTTLSEAVTILRRNASLFVSSLILGDTDNFNVIHASLYGCPHCRETVAHSDSDSCSRHGYECDTCAWQRDGLNVIFIVCLEARFGGITVRETGINYCATCESLKRIETNVKKRERFLRGHMEWALNLMHGDMKAVEKSFRTKSKEKG